MQRWKKLLYLLIELTHFWEEVRRETEWREDDV